MTDGTDGSIPGHVAASSRTGRAVMVTQPGTSVIVYLVLCKPPGMIGNTPTLVAVAPLPVNVSVPEETRCPCRRRRRTRCK